MRYLLLAFSALLVLSACSDSNNNVPTDPNPNGAELKFRLNSKGGSTTVHSIGWVVSPSDNDWVLLATNHYDLKEFQI